MFTVCHEPTGEARCRDHWREESDLALQAEHERHNYSRQS